jgi:hypothetical protein
MVVDVPLDAVFRPVIAGLNPIIWPLGRGCGSRKDVFYRGLFQPPGIYGKPAKPEFVKRGKLKVGVTK